MNTSQKTKKPKPVSFTTITSEGEVITVPLGFEGGIEILVNNLESWSESSKVPEGLREILTEDVIPILKWQYLLKKRGPRPKLRYQKQERILHDWVLLSEIAREKAAMRERGEVESDRGAEEVVALRHNIEPSYLRRKLAPYRGRSGRRKLR